MLLEKALRIMKKGTSLILQAIPRKHLHRIIRFIPKLASIAYRGSEVFCVVCKQEARKFMPYGRGESERENALCPNCLSLERHRLIWSFLKRKTNFFDNQLRMLHIAPEVCFIDRIANLENIDYITADLESPLAQVKLDVHNIPFVENSFDIVMCNHVLEHVDDDQQAMREIFRVLRRGGWAIMQSPIDYDRTETYEDSSITSPRDRALHFGQNDHQRVFGLDYSRRLTQAGFAVTEERLVQAMSPSELARFGFESNEVLFFCEKAPRVAPDDCWPEADCDLPLELSTV